MRKRFYSLLLITTFLSFSIIWSSVRPIHTLNALKGVTADTIPPSITITDPSYPPTIYTKIILVKGAAFDSGSGVQKVEAFVHTFPFKGEFMSKSVTPISPGNWSEWSFALVINTTGSYRIVTAATDNAGNQNWAEQTINFPFLNETSRIAFVRPTFTEAAYGENGFYSFYDKYDNSTDVGANVTSDLNMLTTLLPPSVAEIAEEDYVAHVAPDQSQITPIFNHWSNLTALVPSDADQKKYWIPLTDHVKRMAPNSTITIMRDEDVHDSHIFWPDGSNAYDVLVLLHNEYATQKEYDNFKHFVSNGGTILFIDANIFYAEVKYDKDKHTATLVKGHDWEFDGKVAKKSVAERWYNETKEWVGGNWLVNSISDKISFANNPFNYTHFEEQFVNNPNDSILIDYGIKFPKDYRYSFPDEFKQGNVTIATYELNQGKGKVIMIGLYGQRLMNNEAFLKFFDNIILQHVLAPRYNLVVDGNEFVIYWLMKTGKVSNIKLDKQSKSFTILLERYEQKEDNLLITLPKKLLYTYSSGGIANFTVIVNGKQMFYNDTSDDLENGVEVPLSRDATKVQIFWNKY
jgi:hypothetical protein